MKNILDYLNKNVEERPDKIAIKDEKNICTYSKLQMYSKKIGSQLLNYSEPRTPIAVLTKKSIDAIYCFLGSVYAGCFYSYLNSDLPIERLKNIIETLETKVIIYDIANDEVVTNLKKIISDNIKVLKVEDLKNSMINEEGLNKIKNQFIDLDPLYANFTSGSTGKPKGVIVGNRSVLDFIDVFTKEFNITEADIIANQAPFDFDVSVKDIYSALKTGATLLIIPKELFSKPAELLDYIADNNTTTMIWAVSALCLITTFHGLNYRVPETVNKVMFSGEVMPLKHLKQWVEKLPDAMFVNLYGPTEITCNCTYHIVNNKLNYEKQIPIGKAFDNEKIILLDNNNKEITDIEKCGEICVKGTALALGYYNEPKQTSEKFIQNPNNNKYLDLIYKTGDLGYYLNDGNLYFAGRKDFQIKHMGHRIELEEIERTIDKQNGIIRTCCLYREDKNKIYCFYIGNIEKDELHMKLKNILPVYMLPNVYKKINEFPITKNGKIDRKILMTEIEKK